MQIFDIDLRLAGDVRHVLPKEDVTAAEILVLQRIHALDAVINIRPKREEARSHAVEFQRLVDRYAGAGSRAGGDPTINLDHLFPGAVKRLPETLEEAGLGEAGAVPPPLADEANVTLLGETVHVQQAA